MHLVQGKGERGEVQGRVSLVEVMVAVKKRMLMFSLQLQRGSGLCWFSTSMGRWAEVVEGSHYLLCPPRY